MIKLDWEYVYQCSAENYKEVLKERIHYYNDIKKEDYKTIDACVAFALKSGNHVAFAKYFIEKAMSNVSIFSKKLQEVIDSGKNIGVQWGNLKFMESACWRSTEFIYTKENVTRASYGKAMLSNWKNGACIPDRDVIMQIGLSLGLNGEKTNELLRLAGYEKMYVLDIVDTIMLYYLDYYCDSKIPPFEKLQNVKHQINIYLEKSNYEDMIGVSTYKKSAITNKFEPEEKQIINEIFDKFNRGPIPSGAFQDGLKGIDFDKIPNALKEKYGIKLCGGKVASRQKESKQENLIIGMPEFPENREQARRFFVWNAKKETWYRYEQKGVKRIGLINTLDKDIDNTIKNYRDYLEKNIENKRKESNTEYLTVLFHEKLRKSITNKNLDEFLNSYINDNALRGIYSLRYYGYLKKTIEYLETPEAYIKNIKYSPLELVANKTQRFIDKSNKKEIYLNSSCEKFAKNLEKNKTFQNPRETYLRIVNTIWKLENVIEQKGFLQEVVCPKGKYLKVRMLIEGRNIGGSDFGLEQENNKKEAYVLDIGNKTNLITGQEEHIGQYLKLAGFWDCDLYSFSDAEIEQYICDRTDLLIVYAHRYKEELLRAWSEKLENKLGYKNQEEIDFPFIKLLMLINREIQFIAKEIKHFPEKSGGYLRESISELLKDMVYPLKIQTEAKWAEGSSLFGKQEI